MSVQLFLKMYFIFTTLHCSTKLIGYTSYILILINYFNSLIELIPDISIYGLHNIFVINFDVSSHSLMTLTVDYYFYFFIFLLIFIGRS